MANINRTTWQTHNTFRSFHSFLSDNWRDPWSISHMEILQIPHYKPLSISAFVFVADVMYWLEWPVMMEMHDILFREDLFCHSLDTCSLKSSSCFCSCNNTSLTFLYLFGTLKNASFKTLTKGSWSCFYKEVSCGMGKEEESCSFSPCFSSLFARRIDGETGVFEGASAHDCSSSSTPWGLVSFICDKPVWMFLISAPVLLQGASQKKKLRPRKLTVGIE